MTPLIYMVLRKRGHITCTSLYNSLLCECKVVRPWPDKSVIVVVAAFSFDSLCPRGGAKFVDEDETLFPAPDHSFYPLVVRTGAPFHLVLNGG